MYDDDTPRSLYNEFCQLEDEIESVGRNIKTLATIAETSIADYETAKNKTLLELHAEESSPEWKGKRTEALREAIYRERHHDLRVQRAIAIADLKSERDLLSALQSKLTGLQSRKGILMTEWEGR